LVLGLLGYAVAMLSFALVDRVWGIVAARIIQGIASSFVWLAANAVTADVASEGQRGRLFGSVTQESSRGSIIGAFIGFTLVNAGEHMNGQVAGLGTWQLMFLIYAAASAVAAFLAWRSLRETNPRTRGESRSRPIVWSRPWNLLMLVTLVTGASWAMVSPILIITLQERLGADATTLSWAFLPSGLVWALLPARLGTLADRFGRKPLIILGLVMAAISSFAVPFLTSVIAFAALWALQALCYAAATPAEQALVADLIGGDQRGRAYGIYAMAADLGATIGPIGGTWLYAQIGAGVPFYANGIILAACAVLLALLLHVPARATATPA
jgi:MFS family permease